MDEVKEEEDDGRGGRRGRGRGGRHGRARGHAQNSAISNF